MMLAIIIVLIALTSMALSYQSIRSEIKKGKHIEEVKKDLEKERVIFYAPAHKTEHKE